MQHALHAGRHLHGRVLERGGILAQLLQALGNFGLLILGLIQVLTQARQRFGIALQPLDLRLEKFDGLAFHRVRIAQPGCK
jgi:hypothetical protein